MQAMAIAVIYFSTYACTTGPKLLTEAVAGRTHRSEALHAHPDFMCAHTL
jgi:hypothetical protein